MAISASELLCKHPNDYRLSNTDCAQMCDAATYTREVGESRNIFDSYDAAPKVIISASEMATGGRILHHLKHYLGDQQNTIVLAGFQAGGTRGDRLAKGETTIKIHGPMWPVKGKIEMLDNLSAHADYKEILGWLDQVIETP